MEADVAIGTLPISECEDLVRHIWFLYQNKRCRCQMSDIADMKSDVDAHLWFFYKTFFKLTLSPCFMTKHDFFMLSPSP